METSLCIYHVDIRLYVLITYVHTRRVRMASVLPRILPSSEYMLVNIRERMKEELDFLIQSSDVLVDNSPPLNFGFSQGCK